MTRTIRLILKESAEPGPRKLTKEQYKAEFGEADIDVINAGREPQDRVEIIDEEQLNESRDRANETLSKFIYDLTNGTDYDVYGYTAWENRNLLDAKGRYVNEVSRNGKSNYTLEDIKKAVLEAYPELEVSHTSNDNKIFFIRKDKNDKKESVVLRQDAADITDETPDVNGSSMNEEEYINLNDGKETEPDYIIQDVTELEDITDEDVESPSIEGLLSLVNESLTEKYGATWGYIKAHSISKLKENMQYAIVDIVTPSILKEAKEAKIKDRAVSKTIILESVENSKLVNFKVNTLAGTTRFSQKTNNPVKVFSRWLESEYLYDEMAEDFQKKLEARQQSLKDSTESFLALHPELKLKIDTIKAQEKMLKDAGMLDNSKATITELAYGVAAEFPANIEVKADKDNKKVEQKFDNIDEIVKLLFGEAYVKEQHPVEKKVLDGNKKAVAKAQKESSLKEAYQAFTIGEIQGMFNTDTGEAMYSIPSKNIKDKKLNLSKIPTTETPYDTETIIKDYIEKNFGSIQSDEEPEETTEVEPEPEVTVDNTTDVEVDLDDKEIEEDNDQLPEEPTGTEPTEPEEDVQSETGTATFYKIRQREPVNIDGLLEKSGRNTNEQQSQYIVVKEEHLSSEEMDNLLSDLSKPQSFLVDVESVDRKNYPFNVVKVTSDNSPYTLLIDSVGYDYPRYISIAQ